MKNIDLKKLHEVCFKDLTDQKFGKLTVRGIHHKKGKIYYWECMCDCGNTTIVDGGSLRRGHTKSCGCLHKKALLKNLVGMRFGNLVVESYSKQIGKKNITGIASVTVAMRLMLMVEL